MDGSNPQAPKYAPEEYDDMIDPPFEEAAEFLKGYRNRYEGKRCFIIGNGPSLRVEDLDKIKGEYSIGSNQVYRLFKWTEWRPTVYTRLDAGATWQLRDEVAAIQAELKLIPIEPGKKMCPIKGLTPIRMFANLDNWIAKGEMPPFSDDITVGVHNGMSVTYTNLQAAAYLGFSEIVLIGMDHQYTRHWHICDGYEGRVKENPEGGDLAQFYGRTFFVKGVTRNNFTLPDGGSYGSGIGTGKDTYGGYPIEEVTRSYMVARKYFESRGIRILNATRGGKLEVFERVNLDKYLNPPAAQAVPAPKKKEVGAKKAFQNAAKKRRG